MGQTERAGVKSIVKGMNLLAKFSEQQRDWGITELAEVLGYPKSTVHAMVKSFEEAKMLEQTHGNRYKLGVTAFQLGYVARMGSDIYQLANPLLEDLFSRTEQIVYFAIPHAGRVLYVELFYQSSRSKVSYSIAGRTAPMHCTGLGKAMLSQMEPEQVAQIIEIHGLPSYTRFSITDPDVLLAELQLTRERGYAVDNRESDPMIGCVAMPFRVRDGELAAVSVSGSYTTFTDEKIMEYVDSLAYTCSELGKRIERLPFRVSLTPEAGA